MFNKAILLALPFAVQLALAGPCVRTYNVVAGDICDGISAANHVSTYQLAVINIGVIDDQCGNLVPGSELCIGYEGEDCQDTYVVAAYDTCDAITSDHGIDSATLHSNNPQINDSCDNIYIGEVLCVASSVQVPPAPGADYTPPAATIPATAAPAASPPPAPEFIIDETDPTLPFCDEL